MEIVSKRFFFGDRATLSEVAVDGQGIRDCRYILEDVVREKTGVPVTAWKVSRETAIPVGRYEVVIDMSPSHHKLMLHMLNVPGYSGVRIHSGNDKDDTEGCLITGLYADEHSQTVSSSRYALQAITEIIKSTLDGGERVWWTVEGLPA